jgi:hypothetical protein
MNDDDRREVFDVLASEVGDAFAEILTKAEDLIVLTDGDAALCEDAAKLFERLAEDWAHTLRRLSPVVPG